LHPFMIKKYLAEILSNLKQTQQQGSLNPYNP